MGLVGLTLWIVESQIAGVTSQEGTCLEEHCIRKGFHLFWLFGEFGGCVFVGVLFVVCVFVCFSSKWRVFFLCLFLHLPKNSWPISFAHSCCFLFQGLIMLLRWETEESVWPGSYLKGRSCMLILKIYVFPGNSSGCNLYTNGCSIMYVRFVFHVWLLNISSSEEIS